MSAGDYPAGDFPAGYQAPALAIDAATDRPAALFFDGRTRDFPIAADGRYQAVHPVDAAVQTALFQLEGRIPAAPGVGWEIGDLQDFAGDRAESTATQMVKRALAHLTDTGAITITRIAYEAKPSGPFVQVDYKNNRTGQPGKATN